MHTMWKTCGAVLIAALILCGPGWTKDYGGGFDGGGATTDDGDGHGGQNPRRSDPTPGSQGGYSWGTVDLKAAKELKKPIILYIYDDSIKKNNHTVRFFELDIFAKPEVQKALQNFTFIMVANSSPDWPDAITSKAAGGCAVFLMTYDGTIHKWWKKDMRPSLEEFITTIYTVAASNPKVIERLEKNKPLEVNQPVKVDLDQKAPPSPVANQPVAYQAEVDTARQKELIKELAKLIDKAIKDGETLKAWLTFNGRKEELALGGANENILFVGVQGNSMPLKWEKIDNDEIFDLAKNTAAGKGERLLLAGEYAIAIGKADDAIVLLAQARSADPELAPKVDSAVSKIKERQVGK